MLNASCLCGAIHVAVKAQPDFINDCNCSLCRKSGAAWGYYSSSCVEVTGGTTSFVRQDKTNSAVEVHACPQCATTTHWVLTKSFLDQNGPVNRMGVNMRLFNVRDLDGVEVRFPDGDAWSGEGDYGYRRPGFTIGKSARL